MDKNPYRGPELSTKTQVDDDVIRQPGTMAALLLAVGLIFGIGLLYLGTSYGPSRVVQSQAPITQPETH